MAHTAKLFGRIYLSLANKEIDLDADSLKLMLCTSAYTPDQDAHQYKSSVTNEVTGTGYTAGGKALENVAVTYDPATNALILDADDVSWAASTLTARHAVLYDDTPATNKPLLGFVTFESDISSTSAPFQVIWNASGILRIAAS
ncbi:hypothetical protein F8M49_20705 [Rhodococcus zopfii]|uniref:Uncharacterized protein n=1 Tax=Rhodococcus zopfii TaxID=43772 RepID=A0ABU3WT17_9NOCA|nr:hypothetical protein [Rhodococcus zopfii]